ncbi:GGDEF domain-containing phosphodiesterase [Gordonia sp. NPDC003376]
MTKRAVGAGDPGIVVAFALDPYRRGIVAFGRTATVARAEQLVARIGNAIGVPLERRGDLNWVLRLDADADSLAELVDRLRAALSNPMSGPVPVNGLIEVTAGVALAAELPGVYDDDLERCADAALSEAITDGLSVVFAEAGMRERITEEVRLATRLAVTDTHEFIVHYQPIMTLGENRRTVGYESLMRWDTREGLLGPAEFMTAAEASSMIVPIGRHTIELAIADLAQRIGPRLGSEAFVSVNLSVQQLRDADQYAHMAAMIEAYEVTPSSIWIEVSEKHMVGVGGQTAAAIEALHDLGCKICVDDLGAGFSALRYVRDLPVDVLKVDRALIWTLDSGESGRAIVQAICDMARAIGVTTVAEGIENADMLAAVEELGFDYAQGYHLGRPGPIENHLATA